jgi:hypothetical protein
MSTALQDMCCCYYHVHYETEAHIDTVEVELGFEPDIWALMQYVLPITLHGLCTPKM